MFKKEGLFMKKWISTFSVIMIIFLAACGNAENDANSSGGEGSVPAAIDASISIPSQIKRNEEVRLEVTVTQGDESVEDADEVKFELWEDGKKDNGELIEAEHENDGKYVASYTFEKDAIYHIQSHVTARSMHTMPKVKVAVGSAEIDNEEENQGHSAHEHDGNVAIHISPTADIKTNEETPFDIHITKEEQGLEEANVRLEIVQSIDDHQVAWVDAVEETSGMYTAAHAFTDNGTYKIVVHVENDEGLHEHSEFEVIVN
ncbi:hypothetical protein CKF48_14490 [Cytobacillus kochii]|uniref:YtkA-like domain-containing protein n=2 Tax=Bacillaceae TaxID=186817 RepID=A0A248TJS8_9BACI|nr:hypothetical protein CKF48_14490 [Cytobacillus kochii]